MVSQTKSRKIPTRKTLPPFLVSRYSGWVHLDGRGGAHAARELEQVRAAGHSISPPWGSIRFGLALRTYDAPLWGAYVWRARRNQRKISTRKISPPLFVIKYLTWHHSRSIALVHDLTRITALVRDQVLAGSFMNGMPCRGSGTTVTYASRSVQFHPNGGRFDVVWLPARTMHPHAGPPYVWCLAA